MTTHDYTNLFFATCSNPWNLCGKIIPLFFQDLKVFAICPQGFALAYGKNLREFWKRCWHRPGPFSWGSVEYDSSANSVNETLFSYFGSFIFSWSFDLSYHFPPKAIEEFQPLNILNPVRCFLSEVMSLHLDMLQDHSVGSCDVHHLASSFPPASLIRPFKSLFILGANGWQPQLFIF